MSHEEFLSCFRNGDLNTLKQLYKNYKQHNNKKVTYGYYHNPLVSASHHGHLEMCKWIYENDFWFHPEYRPIHCEMAMRLACINGHVNICKWLCNLPELKNINDHLTWYCYVSHFNVCKWLCKKYSITKEEVVGFHYRVVLKFDLKNCDEDAITYLYNFVNLTEEELLPIINHLSKETKEKLIKLITPVGSFTKPVKL